MSGFETAVAVAGLLTSAIGAVSSFTAAGQQKREAARAADLAKFRGKQEAEAAAREADQRRRANLAAMAAAGGTRESGTNRAFLADFDEQVAAQDVAIRIGALNQARTFLAQGNQQAGALQRQGISSAVSFGKSLNKNKGLLGLGSSGSGLPPTIARGIPS